MAWREAWKDDEVRLLLVSRVWQRMMKWQRSILWRLGGGCVGLLCDMGPGATTGGGVSEAFSLFPEATRIIRRRQRVPCR